MPVCPHNTVRASCRARPYVNAPATSLVGAVAAPSTRLLGAVAAPVNQNDTPCGVLSASEAFGWLCTGRCLPNHNHNNSSASLCPPHAGQRHA